MKRSNLANLVDFLFGHKAKLSHLMFAAAILIFSLLGWRDIWTQEHRWADIVFGMFYRQDFLHPYLGENTYYDKPLLSYWLIVLASHFLGGLTTWTLRLPSAAAGLLAVWSIYRLGTKIDCKRTGFLSGWLLLTTFYFLFWARTSSADMLNLAGSLFAVSWYMDKRQHASFFDYSIFFLIVALTSLCKGLLGAVIPFIAVITDMFLQKSWKKHLHFSLLLSAIPAALIYLFPFWASNHFDGGSYGQSGLYLVYRENVLRYFQPFDHQGPFYTYFLYLPIYMMPWTVCFIPALFALWPRWRYLTLNTKWVGWTLFFVFLFFSLSGSRRSYYVLPMVPFAILLTAEWISSLVKNGCRLSWLTGALVFVFFVLFILVDAVPAWYDARFGVAPFAAALKNEAGKQKPWSEWNIVMLDAESKLNFYLSLPPDTKNYSIDGKQRNQQTAETLSEAWPILQKQPKNTIFITRKRYEPLLSSAFAHYRKIEIAHAHFAFLQQQELNAPIAFVPEN